MIHPEAQLTYFYASLLVVSMDIEISLLLCRKKARWLDGETLSAISFSMKSGTLSFTIKSTTSLQGTNTVYYMNGE